MSISFLNFSSGWRGLLTLGNILAAVWFVLSAGLLPARGQSGDAGYVTVQTAPVTPHLEAYGQIELGATLTLSFAEAGEVAGLGVLPGAQVRAGQGLAHLTGPEIGALLSQSQADVQSAQTKLSASQKALAIQRQQLTLHQSTPQAVHQAETAVARAQTDFDNSQSHLQDVRQMMTLSAPVDATVLMANTADGQSVSSTQPVITLQTPYRLWLHAAYNGFDLTSIRAGMTGTFSPADGSESIPVRVYAVFGVLEAGGGVSITLLPATPTPRWLNGEFGTVALNLPPRSLVAVPTRTLILDQGKWWVMVHTPHGDHPQAVVPGPSRGWQTFLEKGLDPGAQVVVDNAYLLFHQDISRRYQPPD